MSERRSDRAGFNLVGLVLLLFAFLVIGLAASRFAVQSGRSSHWFLQSQLAYDLADAGMKETLHLLQEYNSPTAAQNSGHPLGAHLTAIQLAVAAGSAPGPLPIMSSSGGFMGCRSG